MIALIDYDAGNTCSVMNALDRLKADYVLSDNPELIKGADKVIFPGVGHAGAAMQALKRKGLVDTIKSLQQPVLGICVGMQLLAESSREGETRCLGILPGRVTRFDNSEVKVPHMGWNQLKFDGNDEMIKRDEIFMGLPDEGFYYFVHSYYLPLSEYSIASCSYDITFSAAVRKDNFRGIQFHAEKSGQNGARLLENFLEEKL